LLFRIGAKANDVTPSWPSAGDFKILRKVTLEDEAKVLLSDELGHLRGDLRSQLGIRDPVDEVVEVSHDLHRTGAADVRRG
jgi:hypothetical protein